MRSSAGEGWGLVDNIEPCESDSDCEMHNSSLRLTYLPYKGGAPGRAGRERSLCLISILSACPIWKVKVKILRYVKILLSNSGEYHLWPITWWSFLNTYLALKQWTIFYQLKSILIACQSILTILTYIKLLLDVLQLIGPGFWYNIAWQDLINWIKHLWYWASIGR